MSIWTSISVPTCLGAQYTACTYIYNTSPPSKARRRPHCRHALVRRALVVSADTCAYYYNCPRNCAAVTFRGGTHGKASRQHAAGWQGRRASGPPPPAKQRPIETSFLRIPSRHQDRKNQGGSRQLFRDVTALDCPGSSVRLGRGLPRYSTWNPQPNLEPLHCLARARPEPWSPSNKLPRLLSPWFAPSIPFIHPSSLPSSSLPDGIGTGQTERDRARWSGPCPVSDHAPVREKDETVGSPSSREPTRGCTLAG